MKKAARKQAVNKKTVSRKKLRDIEKAYPLKQFAGKLRRLADAVEQGKPFRIQIAGEQITISPKATINIEHERSTTEEEVEFQLRWSLA